jgi:predicted phosphate transport protein (TIGR00153 family)
MTPLIPRDNTFFEMFSQMSENLIAGARTLVGLFTDYTDLDAKVAEIRRIERVGDEMTHAVLTKLNQSFITPFDREDIHQLTSSLDDVLDLMNAACARIIMYRITNPPPVALEIARVILLQSQEVQRALSLLRKNGDILTHCVEINRLENEADVISRAAIGQLFDQEKDPITLLKSKELIEFLELATDKAEDVANVLETIVLKSS